MGKDVSSQHPDVEDADVITVDDAMSSGWPGEFSLPLCLNVQLVCVSCNFITYRSLVNMCLREHKQF